MRQRDLAVVPDLERELDELYGLPLEQFTAARNDLAKRLKKAGQKEEADRVGALRKPPISAWAVNQVARREPGAVRDLLAAGQTLLDAQRQALAGEGVEGFDEAGRRQRDAIRAVVRSALKILGEVGHSASAAVEERIASSLRAAAVDSDARARLEGGTLDADVESSGLDLLAGMVPAAGSGEARTSPSDTRIQDAKAALEAARGTARELKREAVQAERAAARAQAAADEARGRSESLGRDAERAEEAVEQAEQELARLVKRKRGRSRS